MRDKKRARILKAEEIYLQGVELFKQKKFQEAITQFNEVVRLNRKHALAHLHLCLCYVAFADSDSAHKHYYILNRLDPDLARELMESPVGNILFSWSLSAIHTKVIKF